MQIFPSLNKKPIENDCVISPSVNFYKASFYMIIFNIAFSL